MKKFFKTLYCVVFFAIISAPLVFMFIGADTQENAENRPLAPAPVLIDEDGKINLQAPIEAEKFFGDRYAGRVTMIRTYSQMVGKVFGVSANDRVIMGRDGWLFFSETIGDFDGSSALDDTEMDMLIRNLLDMKKQAQERGQVFIIAVAPNKNTIYGEFMPSGYRKTDKPTNLERLLAVSELECLDLGAILTSVAETSSGPVYLKTDSHWSALGTHAVANAIIREIEAKTGVETNIDWYPAATEDMLLGKLPELNKVSANSPTGDLWRMLYPGEATEETDALIVPTSRFDFSTTGRFRSWDDMNITTTSQGAPLKVAMYRDSFAISLIPYISTTFSDVFYTRQTPPPMNRREFSEADVIIFEIVERRLGELIDNSPVTGE